MKDSYSFDVDEEGLEASYNRHRDAYISTFDRLGLPYVIVSAMSGAMGGSASEEFLAPIDVGEDTFVQCTYGYAANTDGVAATPAPSVEHPAATVVDTPNTPTIDSLVVHLNATAATQRSDRPWAADDTLKTWCSICSPRWHRRASRHRNSRKPRSRSQKVKRQVARRTHAIHRCRLREVPVARQGLHRPQALGTDSPLGRYRDPDRGRYCVGHRGEYCWAPRHSPCKGRDFTAEARSRQPKCSKATCSRGAPMSTPAASRSAISSNSAANMPKRSTSRCWMLTVSR